MPSFLSALLTLLLAAASGPTVPSAPARASVGPVSVAPPSTAPASVAAARPLVLLVHGRGDLGDTAVFRRTALLALREGAEAMGGSGIVRDEDVRLVWYADLLAGRAAKSDKSDKGEAERDGCAATRVRSGDDPMDLFSSFAGAILEFVAADAGASSDEDALPVRSLRGIVGDLRFLTDPGARCLAGARIGRALADAQRAGRPVVLVAHSLGGLVAWDHLRTRSAGAPPIHTFVTVGSLVGSPEVRELLFGAPGALRLPRGVGAWINVLDDTDPFSAPLLADSSAVSSDGPRLRDARTESRRDDPHELRGYLRDPATTHAIIEAWCEAAGGAKPAECGNVGLTR